MKHLTLVIMLALAPLSWGEKLRCSGSFNVGWASYSLPVFFTLQGDDPVVRFGDSRIQLLGRQHVRGVRVLENSDLVLEGVHSFAPGRNIDLDWKIDKSTMKVELNWSEIMNYVRTRDGDMHRFRGGKYKGSCRYLDRLGRIVPLT